MMPSKVDGIVMLEKELVSNLINLKNSTFFGKKKPFGMCIVQMSDMIGGAISKAGKFFCC